MDSAINLELRGAMFTWQSGIQALLCMSQSVGGSSRTTAVGSGSDLAAALSLPQLGIFRKWAWAMEKQNGNALNLSSLRRILFSPGTATRRPTTSIPHRRKTTLHCAKCQ